MPLTTQRTPPLSRGFAAGSRWLFDGTPQLEPEAHKATGQLTAGTRFCLDSSDQSGHSVMYLELRVKDPDRDLTFTATAWKQSAR
ncbi:hypothetical protein ACFV4F_35440 [Kitasatospora sp. NPDC059722]|uniref:hypothetical protein n=1 Tax=Kitasatospora sp. NPDC059722 TaxID=3346925 RepID=UPI0036AF450B